MSKSWNGRHDCQIPSNTEYKKRATALKNNNSTITDGLTLD